MKVSVDSQRDGEPRAAKRPMPARTAVDALLALQHSAGNAAVARKVKIGRADALLAFQRSAGNAAVARKIKIGKAIGPTDKAGAAAKAEQLRAVRLTGTWGQAQDEAVYHYLDFFEGEAMYTFIRTLASTDGEQSLQGGRTINDPGGGNFTIGKASAIFPVSKAREARGGFRVTFA